MTRTIETPNPTTQPARIGHAASAYAQGATKIYGAGATRLSALNDVDFGTGHSPAIMGPSGSRKSTPMRGIAGLDRLDSSAACIGDIDEPSASERDLTFPRREPLGFDTRSVRQVFDAARAPPPA